MGQFVKYYSSAEFGAPALTNAAGTATALFDAVLVNGYGSKTLTSLSVSSNVATAVVTGGHQFNIWTDSDKDITIEGATPALLNGDKHVTIIDANTFTFPAPGVVDGAATGTITAKRTPLGWIKAFSGTNKAIYKSGDVTSSGLMFRVVDTTASSKDFRAHGCETATDVDTFTNSFLANAQTNGGFYWAKGANTTRVKNWMIIGDSKLFYFLVECSFYSDSGTYRTSYGVYVFGDFVSFRPADTANAVINGSYVTIDGASDASPFFQTTQLNTFNDTSTYNLILAKDYLLSTPSIKCNITWPYNIPAGGINKLYPSPVNQGVLFFEGLLLMEQNTGMQHPVRGLLPGIANVGALSTYFPLSTSSNPIVHYTQDAIPKKYLLIPGVMGGSIVVFAVNVSDNWRG